MLGKLFIADSVNKTGAAGSGGGAFQGIGKNRSVALSSGLVSILRQIAQQFEEVLRLADEEAHVRQEL